jgi:hypothetical protein
VAYESGVNLFVVSTEAHGWWLGFWNSQWSFTPNASMPIKLRFDALPQVDLLGTVANSQTLLVPMPDGSRLIDRFQRGSQLSVTAQEQSFLLNLGGTSTVMSELKSCVRTSLAFETRSPSSPVQPPAAAASALETQSPPTPAISSSAPETPPASSPVEPPMPAVSAPETQSPPASAVASGALEMRLAITPAVPPRWSPPEAVRPPQARPKTELEEAKLARNFLLAARLPNARLIETEKPAALAKFSAVWRSDDGVGAVQIIPPGRDVTGAAIASELISVDPRLCKGNFASARSSGVVDSEIVFRAALSCMEAQNELTTQYFITPRQKGGFVVFAVIGSTGRDAAFTSDRQRIDLFEKAAVQAAGPGD